jgi:hypothetical protein
VNVADNRWVFLTKLDADGLFEKLRARLLAEGYVQKAGIDYDEKLRHSTCCTCNYRYGNVALAPV